MKKSVVSILNFLNREIDNYFSLGAINIGYETTSYQTNESQGVVELTIVLIPSGPAPRPFTLFVSTTDNTAGIYLAEVQLNLTTCFLSSRVS